MTPIDSEHLIWWLRRELDADEAAARPADYGGTWDDVGEATGRFLEHHDPASVLADVAAKRSIVDHCERWLAAPTMPHNLALTVLREMATGLAGRDGFEDIWRVQ